MIIPLKRIFASDYVRIAAFVALALITAVFLSARYVNMGIGPESVFRFIGVFLVACMVLLGATLYFKNALNPINFYVIFILCYGFNFLKLSADSTDLSPTTHLILILSIIFFVLGVILGNKLKSEPKVWMNRQSKATIFYVTYLCIVFSFILEVIGFGYLPLLKIFSIDVYKETNEKLVSFLHYFIMLAPIVPAWAYILYRKEILTKKKYIWLSIGALFILINYLSRQLFFLFLFSAFITYSFYYRVSIVKIISALFFVVFIFVFMGNIRIMKSSSVLNNVTAEKLIRGLGNIHYKTNILESYVNIYSSKRFDQMNRFVELKKQENFYGLGIFTFRPVCSVLFLDRSGIVKYGNYDITSNISSYAIDPYLDFGLIGVIILNLLYGFICRLAFINFNEGNSLYIIPWALLIFCMVMAPFMNYFNTFIIWYALLFNRLILK